MLNLPGHSRYAFSPIVTRPDYCWPEGKRLAFYIALNIEHFAFGTGLGMDPVHSGLQNARHYAWRDYGSRIGHSDLPITIGITNLYSHRSQTLNYTRTGSWEIGLRLFLADIEALTSPG